jgi:hypothetical protein
MRRALPILMALVALPLAACDLLAYDYGATDRDATDGGPDGGTPDGGNPDGGVPDGGPIVCPAGTATCGGGGACETNILSDHDNCGMCGNTCYAAQCVQGNCDVQRWSTSVAASSGLASDGTNLFWALDGGATVRRVPVGLPASSAQQQDYTSSAITSGTSLNPHGLVSDGTFVYWSNPDTGPVLKANIGGGSPVQIAAVAATAFARGTDGVYFLSPAGNALYRIPAGSNTAQNLVTLSGLIDIASDANGTYVISYGNDGYTGLFQLLNQGANYGTQYLGRYFGQGTSIALDANYVYWGMSTGGIVRWRRIVGEVPQLLTQTNTGVRSLVADLTGLYWVSSATDAAPVFRLLTVNPVAAQVYPTPAVAVALDSTAGILFLDANNSIYRIAR